MADAPKTRDDAIRKVGELIKDIKIAMLTTAGADGCLRSRPMATQQAEFDGDLWFFTSDASPKADEIRNESHVNLSYAAPDENCFVSVSGKATLVKDRAKVDELWNPMYKAWFPEGKDDPNLTLLKVEVDQAQYWDAPSSGMVLIPGFIQSLLTKKPFEPGENAKLEL